jgi:hypothetical protein
VERGESKQDRAHLVLQVEGLQVKEHGVRYEQNMEELYEVNKAPAMEVEQRAAELRNIHLQ